MLKDNIIWVGCIATVMELTKDYSEALKWYQKSAAQGNTSAQTSLGWMYEKGYGVAKSYSEALKWYRKAAQQGDETAQDNLRNLGETW